MTMKPVTLAVIGIGAMGMRHAERVHRHPACRCRPLADSRVEIAPADPLHEQLCHFCRVISGEEAALIDAHEGARSLALALAVKTSAERNIPVKPAALFDA